MNDSIIKEIEKKLPLLDNKKLIILLDIINSWNANSIVTDDNLVKDFYSRNIDNIENPIDNMTKEEILEEYGPLFYSNSITNSDNISNFSVESIDNDKKKDFDYLSMPNSKDIDIDNFDPLFNQVDLDNLQVPSSKYDNLDISALISKKGS